MSECFPTITHFPFVLTFTFDWQYTIYIGTHARYNDETAQTHIYIHTRWWPKVDVQSLSSFLKAMNFVERSSLSGISSVMIWRLTHGHVFWLISNDNTYNRTFLLRNIEMSYQQNGWLRQHLIDWKVNGENEMYISSVFMLCWPTSTGLSIVTEYVQTFYVAGIFIWKRSELTKANEDNRTISGKLIISSQRRRWRWRYSVSVFRDNNNNKKKECLPMIAILLEYDLTTIWCTLMIATNDIVKSFVCHSTCKVQRNHWHWRVLCSPIENIHTIVTTKQL